MEMLGQHQRNKQMKEWRQNKQLNVTNKSKSEYFGFSHSTEKTFRFIYLFIFFF